MGIVTKYSAKRTELDGYKFDSKAEANWYLVNKSRLQQCEIAELEVHPKFVLQQAFQYNGKTERAIVYEADFAYMENGVYVVEDVKGMQTPVFKIKRKMFLSKYPKVDFRIVEA
jgi:hypothetical protein